VPRSKVIPIKNGCPNCGATAHQIWHVDNHGYEELLETHCNQCGWSIDGEGNLRNEGNLLLRIENEGANSPNSPRRK